MSLLQFAKNNKEYLNLFSALTDHDSRIRSQTVSSIIKQLNDEKAKHEDIEQLQSTALVKYTLQRLIRGLTSSKHSNRIAFANTFSQVLTHCKWLTTAFILQTVHTFCDNEKAKQSTIIESLLLIRNLLILILFQTHRLYQLSWDDLHRIITDIVHSKQAKNLIDLSCQSMICLLNIMEQSHNDDATNPETQFKTLLIGHRLELLKTCAKLIPSPINSFKLVSITQIKLILRIYSNHHQSTAQWALNEDEIDNKTIQILPQKIALVYEFLLKPMKQPPSASASTSLSSMMNIYNDDKMWKAVISLFCNAEDKQERNVKFGKCCDEIFYFMNQNMLKPKYVALVSIVCGVFIRYGVALKISTDTLFTHVLRPAILSFITKYGLKYKPKDTPSVAYKEAFDFMMELKLLCNHATYGSRIKSILVSSSTHVGRMQKDDESNANHDSTLKTLKFYEKVFWRANAFIHDNKSKYRNQLLASERDCVTSIKSIANVLQQFINKGRKRPKYTLQYMDQEWMKAGMKFLIRIVFFKSKTDVFNRSRFENIWLTAKKLLRILLQTAWHVLPSNDAEDQLNKTVFIGLVNDAIESFKEDDALSYRSKNIMAMDAAQMSLKGITQMTEQIDKINQPYVSAAQKQILRDLARFIGVYYYMDDATITVSILTHLRDNILDRMDELESIQFGSKLMDIVVECIESDDMFVSCVSRHVFLAFGDLYNSAVLEKLLRFISTEEEEEEAQNEEDEKQDTEDEESDTDSEDEDMNTDDDEEEEDSDEDEDMEDSDESSSDSDEFDITDYGAFGGNRADESDIDLEGQTVKSEELEQMDQALIAVFREKQKQTETRINAKKSRIQKRVFHYLLLFVKQYKTSPLLLIMFTPLMMALWKLFEEVTDEYQKAKNKQNKKQNDTQDASVDHGSVKEKVAPKMRTAHGVPLWRFDTKLKRSWNDYTTMLSKTNKKQSKNAATAAMVSTKSKHFHSAVAVINGILVHSPNQLVEADASYNEIQLEWIKDIIYDIIELTSQSPTYEHEMLGVKVLCYLCKVYQLKCSERMDHKQIWNHAKLNHDDEEEETDTKEEINQDVLWLCELWYIQLKLFMKQPRRIWYFSREFFDVFMRKNSFVVWKLIYEALDGFELCKNSWSQTQLFVLIGNMTNYCDRAEQDEIQWILEGVAKRIVMPLKESLSKSMDPTKKMLIAQNAGKFVRKLNKYKIEGKEKKEIMNALGNSKLQWKKTKTKTKKYKKSVKTMNKNNKKGTKKMKSQKENKKSKRNMNQKKRKMTFKNVNSNKKSVNPQKKRKLK